MKTLEKIREFAFDTICIIGFIFIFLIFVVPFFIVMLIDLILERFGKKTILGDYFKNLM